MKTLKITLIAALATLTLAGCRNEAAPSIHLTDNPYLADGRIQFERSSVKHDMEINRVDTKRLPSGHLKLILDIRNHHPDTVFAEMRTTFLDDAGHVLDQTNWQLVQLNPRTVSQYTCTSMSPRAADYQVIIRKPDKTSYSKP